MREDRVVELLSCKLSIEEVIEKADRQNSALARIAELEGELDGLKKHYNSEIKKSEAEVEVLRDQISARREMREVECIVSFDFETTKKKTKVRTDTGEVVCVSPILPSELQEELELKGRIEAEEKEAIMKEIGYGKTNS